MAAGLIALIVVTLLNTTGDGPLEVGSPSVTGEGLVPFDPEATDPAVGSLIPEVNGTDFDGRPVQIARDGRAKVIILVAHWCSVCQREIPLLADWLPTAALPEGVDLYTVSTGVDRRQPNYPPSAWFADAGWTLPILLDDEANSVGRAFGLTYYPYYVFADAEGKVVLRRVGILPPAELEALAGRLAEGADG